KGKWPGDAHLTDAAQVALPRSFQKHGYAAFQETRDARIAEAKAEQARHQRFVDCFPEKARRFFDRQPQPADKFEEQDERLGGKIADAVGDREVLAAAVCRAFGTLKDSGESWSMTGDKERRALAAMKTVDGKQFLSALEKMKGDRTALRGAARF